MTGTDSALYHKAWGSGGWTPSLTGYEYLGGIIPAFRPAEPEEAEMIPTPIPQPEVSLVARL